MMQALAMSTPLMNVTSIAKDALSPLTSTLLVEERWNTDRCISSGQP